VARLDYWRWHGIKNLGDGRLEEDVFIWETAGGRIAAVLNRESAGEAHLQVHPGERSAELEEEMVALAEEHLATPEASGRRGLRVWAHQDDSLRQEVLTRQGYARGDWPEVQRERSLEGPIPDVGLPSGYTLRALGEGAELLERCYATGLVFHPEDVKHAVENRADVSWYRNIQSAPLYRRDLDIVAIAPDGAVASFCTLWYDDVTRTGYFEPVGTVPTHQQRGLGKAVMLEGLQRLKRMGGTLATVAGFTTAANALYASVMSPDYVLLERWVKEL
jgi:GNAT superfamily N-acetyltransferase